MFRCGGLIMRIGILGVGALGGLFLHRLSEVESELHLLTRSPTKDALDERGLMVHYDGRPDTLEVVPPQRFQYLDSNSTLDLAIVCGKNHHVSELTGIASQHLDENGKILKNTNGLTKGDLIKTRLAKGEIISNVNEAK